MRMVMAVGALSAAAGCALGYPDYALGSMRAAARITPGGTHFEAGLLEWDRTILWQDLAGQLGTIVVTSVAPINASNPRVSATGDALVSNPVIALNPPYANFRYWLAWNQAPLPRTGVITAGFDTAAMDAPQAESSAPQMYRGVAEGHEALFISVTSGLPAHGGFYDILPGSTMTFDLEFAGRWTLGDMGQGGAQRTLATFVETPPFTIVEDFVYDPVADVTRLRVEREYAYIANSLANSLRINAVLLGPPVPSPGAGALAGLGMLAAMRRRR